MKTTKHFSWSHDFITICVLSNENVDSTNNDIFFNIDVVLWFLEVHPAVWNYVNLFKTREETQQNNAKWLLEIRTDFKSR